MNWAGFSVLGHGFKRRKCHVGLGPELIWDLYGLQHLPGAPNSPKYRYYLYTLSPKVGVIPRKLITTCLLGEGSCSSGSHYKAKAIQNHVVSAVCMYLHYRYIQMHLYTYMLQQGPHHLYIYVYAYMYLYI